MSLNPYMTIKQVIEEPLIVHNEGTEEERREKIIKALNDVRLFPPEEFLLKYPHMLSGGQRQRVGIARALVLDPIFLVADEPVSMIDASSRAEILSLLKELQKTYNMGVMYITHDIATAKYFSDLIAVMYLGKIVEYGETREVINNPLHPYTKALFRSIPRHDRKQNQFYSIEGMMGTPIGWPDRCKFYPRCAESLEGCETTPSVDFLNCAPGHLVRCLKYK